MAENKQPTYHTVQGRLWQGEVPTNGSLQAAWEIATKNVNGNAVESVVVNLAKAKVIITGILQLEAGRRILLICPEWKQRNLIARAAMHAKKDNLTAAEQSEWDAGLAIWDQIDAIRTLSNDLTVTITAANLDGNWTSDEKWNPS